MLFAVKDASAQELFDVFYSKLTAAQTFTKKWSRKSVESGIRSSSETGEEDPCPCPFEKNTSSIMGCSRKPCFCRLSKTTREMIENLRFQIDDPEQVNIVID
jgi:hypothetical protein